MLSISQAQRPTSVQGRPIFFVSGSALSQSNLSLSTKPHCHPWRRKGSSDQPKQSSREVQEAEANQHRLNERLV